MNEFTGSWVDQNGDTITITEKNNELSAKYSNGRGPFAGYEVDLAAPTVTINFTDDKPFTGVLASDKKIYWSNTTIWKKA